MTDTPASPSYTIKIGPKEYTLDGAFETIRSVEQRFSQNIMRVFQNIDEMAIHEVADLIAIGAKLPNDAHIIGQKILEHTGVISQDFKLLKIHLMAWLKVILSSAPDREKKRAEMQAIIDTATIPSPGPTTSASPSASLDGNPQNSG